MVHWPLTGLDYLLFTSGREPRNTASGNQIEGYFTKGQKVVVIEDLISTGGSSLSAVKALREAGCQVLGMTAIFTYEFKKASDAFAAEKCTLNTLCNYTVLIETALKTGYISENDVETLKRWRLDPAVGSKLNSRF